MSNPGKSGTAYATPSVPAKNGKSKINEMNQRNRYLMVVRGMRCSPTGGPMKKIVLGASLVILGAIAAFGQSIVVTSPAAGVPWCRGKSYAITWTSTGAVGATVRIRLMQGTAAIQEIALDTANDGSYDWTIPATTPPGSYTVRVRSLQNTTRGDSGALAITDCGSGPAVIRQIPKFERPPVGLLIPPQLRVTSLTIDQERGILHFEAKNLGGPMKNDAKVLFSLDGSPIAEMNWSKSSPTYALTRVILAPSNPEPFRQCTHLGSHGFAVGFAIQSPDIQGANPSGLSSMAYYYVNQDLAVSGFNWAPSGKLTFNVGNMGKCPSLAWSYRLYKMNQLVETSPRYGSLKAGDWNTMTANYQMPANAGGSCLFKVEVVPDTPGLEKRMDNNSYEIRVVPGAARPIVISNIQLAGEVKWWDNIPKTHDEYYRLVYTLTNPELKAVPLGYTTCKTYIDGALVETQTFPVSFDPGQEVVLLHDYGFPNWPIVPYGIHEVGVEFSICSGFLKKKIIRPPQG